MDTKKLKSMIKNPAPKESFGTDPNDPWSAKAGINETAMLDQYLSTKGVNAKYAPKNLKVAHSKTNAFKKWARDHHQAVQKKKRLQGQVLTLQGEEVEQIDEISKKTTFEYLKKSGKELEHGSPTAAKRDKRIDGYFRAGQRLSGEKKTSGAGINLGGPGRLSTEATEADYGGQHQANVLALKAKAEKKPVDTKSLAARMQASYAKDKEKPVKEDMEQLDELSKDTIKRYRSFGVLRAVGRSANIYDHEVEGGKKPDPEMHRKMALANKNLERADARLKKEEVEQIDEISKDLANRYYHAARYDDDKRWETISAASDKQRKQFSPSRHKSIGKMVDKSTKRGEGIGRALNRLQKEEVEQIDESKKELSKSARMIKALYKHHRVVKEAKDEQSKSYGKPPKHEKSEPEESYGENKPKAGAILTGGTTLTGEKRDDIEIDPMMRSRPGQPDPSKKAGSKDKANNENDK